MGKDSFLFYRDWLDGLKNIEPSLKAELLEAIIIFGLDGEEIELSPTAKAIFGFIRPKMERDATKYDEKCRKLRENAMRAKASKSKQLQPNATNCNQLQADATKSEQIGSDNDNDNVNDNDKQDTKVSMSLEEKKERDKSLSEKKENSQSVPAENKSRFVKPTIEQVAEYIQEKGYEFTADAFYDFYESKGWMIGKNRMKDWKAACRTWNRTRKETQIVTINPNNQHGQIITDGDKRRIDKARRDAEFDELMYELAVTNRPASEDERVKQISTR